MITAARSLHTIFFLFTLYSTDTVFVSSHPKELGLLNVNKTAFFSPVISDLIFRKHSFLKFLCLFCGSIGETVGTVLAASSHRDTHYLGIPYKEVFEGKNETFFKFLLSVSIETLHTRKAIQVRLA